MGVVWTFLLSSILSPLSPSLWETTRYRLKYCLKGSLNPKQPTNLRTLINLDWINNQVCSLSQNIYVITNPFITNNYAVEDFRILSSVTFLKIMIKQCQDGLRFLFDIGLKFFRFSRVPASPAPTHPPTHTF